MSLNSSLLDLADPQSDDPVGSGDVVVDHDEGYGHVDNDDTIFSPSSLAEYRASEIEEAGGVVPLEQKAHSSSRRNRIRGRVEWAADASDEMIFHWLCTAAFNDRGLDHARSTCVVRWNPLYWVAFLVTVLSLFVGREFHILLDQGNAVNAHEQRQEYEVRVHWVYCTTGAMLWVMARSIMTLMYDAAMSEAVNVEEQVVCWVIVAFFCAGNAVFLRMMRLRNMAGVRCIIICNFVFTVCMFASLVYFMVECAKINASDDDDDDNIDDLDVTAAQCKTGGDFWATMDVAFVMFEKLSAVLFFMMATVIYARLWSIYKFDGRDLKQRLCETIPAVIAALAMLVLMFLALVAKNDELQPYVWATFTRRRRS